MIYTACIMFYATYSYPSRSLVFRAALGLGLIALALFITFYYHYVQDPAFHQAAYSILTALVLLKMMQVMEARLRPKVPSTTSSGGGVWAEQASQAKRNQQTLKQMRQLVAYGMTISLAGYALWQVDNRYCTQLRKLRHRVQLPWGLFFEVRGSSYCM